MYELPFRREKSAAKTERLVQNQCGQINLGTKGFDYLAGSTPALPGGHYMVAVKDATDTQFAEGELNVSPILKQLTTVPHAPVRNVQCQFSFAGKGFWVGRSRIRVFHPTLCPHPIGCDPGLEVSPQSTLMRLVGRVSISRPGIFEVGVERERVPGSFQTSLSWK